MQGGLFAKYEKIRIHSSSTFSLVGATCLGGGVGSTAEHRVKTVSVRNFLDPTGTDFFHYTASFYVMVDYKNPEPLMPRHSTIIEFKLFNNTLFILNWSTQDVNDTSNVPTYVNMEFILKKPKFFVIKYNNYFVSMVVADGYYLKIVSDTADGNVEIDSNNRIIVQKYTTNPSEFIFLGGGLYGNSSTNFTEKNGCDGTLEASSNLEYGIQYMFEGENFYRDLPIKIDYLTHNFIRHPTITGNRTSSVSITTPALYSRSGLAITQVNTVAGLQIIPKRERKFIRMYSDDNTVLVYRGTHPRLGKLKRYFVYTNSGSTFNKQFVELVPKCGQLLYVLNEEPDIRETEILDYEFVCPYNIGVNQGVMNSSGGFTNYDYASHLFFENTGFPSYPFWYDLDGVNYNDPDNPIFAHMFSPCVNTVYFGSGSFPYELYNSLINNLYSFWNWCLYFPPDEDAQNWLAPVFGNMSQPEKIYNNEYWGLVREQWINHTRLPVLLRSKKRNYIKEAPLYASDVSERIVRYWNTYFENLRSSGFPEFDWNVYTPDEARTNNLFCYLGFHNSRQIEYVFDEPTIKKANNINRYTFENCVGVGTTNYINITPTSTSIKVKYKVGDYQYFPFLFDILANKFKYKLTGSNISSLTIKLKSFGGDEKVFANVVLENEVRKNYIEQDEKWASSAVQDYSGDISIQNIDRGIELEANNVSSAVFADSEKVINYSLLSSANIEEIVFEITLSSLLPINFYWLEFKYEPRDYWHIIENSNNDVFVSSEFYFRFGNLSFFNRDTDSVRVVPEVKKPTYRGTLIDGLCFSRLFFTAEDKNYNNLRSWLHNMFDKFEAYEYDFFTESFINENSILPFDIDTYWFPVFGINRKTQDKKIKFLYGSYYSMFPPISSIPQYSYNQDNLEKEYVYLYTPHKRFLWNYKKQLRLYKVFYNTSNQEVNRLTYSLPATEYAITDVFVERYNIVDGYNNDEYIKDFTGAIVNSPKYIVGDGETDLSRITPFHGHTYNYVKAVAPSVNKIVYRAFQDINQNDKIYLLGYDVQAQQYVYGYYNIKTNEIVLLPKPERSISFGYFDDLAYLEYVDEFGTSPVENRYEYRFIHGGEEIRKLRIKGRRPAIVFSNDKLIISSRDDRHGGHYVQYFDFALNEIKGSVNLIFSNLADIDGLPYPYAEATSVLDKANKIFIHAHHWLNFPINKKDVGIQFYNTDEGLFVEEFSGITLYFSDIFNNSSISYSHPSITELNDGVIVWATGSNNKVYGVKFNHNYRYGRQFEKVILDVPYELIEYHTPCVYTSINGGIMFLNTTDGIKVIYISENMVIL